MHKGITKVVKLTSVWMMQLTDNDATRMICYSNFIALEKQFKHSTTVSHIIL